MSHFPVGTVVRAMPANSRSVRGLSASLIILAEFAHFTDTAGPASDERMLQASEPSTESVWPALAGYSSLWLDRASGRTVEHQRRTALGDHVRGGVCVSRGDARHHGGVRNA